MSGLKFIIIFHINSLVMKIIQSLLMIKYDDHDGIYFYRFSIC